VFICIRRPSLTETMSQYLIDQIEATPNIKVLPCTEITEGKGEEKLERVTIRDLNTDEAREAPAAAVFIFIGAKPFTDWIEMDIIRDDKGFIQTGRDLINHPRYRDIWKHSREPYSLETCSAGIFAAGDVRSGAMARVASAVGEGAMAVSFVHKYLAES
jgi:thioredoxin reductase (NADPH)